MASNAFTSAGTVVSMSDALPATEDTAGYEALSYTAIGEISDVGELGRQYDLVTFNPISTRETVKRKGSYNQGQLTLQMARYPSDAGQTILRAAEASDNNYSFDLELQDGTNLYFQGQVMGYKTTVGNTNQITMATAVVEITTDIVEVAAT